jgi:nitrite reductase (cytochrome c-552)
MDAVVALINDLSTAQRAGAPAAAVEQARSFHRRSQFLLDFVEAENSTGFHAPQEAARVLSLSIDLARQGQLALRPAPGTSSTTSGAPAGSAAR